MGENGLFRLLLDRGEFLEATAPEPKERRDIVDELGVSKSTAHRVLKRLEGRGLVERTSEGYSATAYGRTCLGLSGFMERHFELLEEHRRVFDYLPDDVSLEPGFLLGCEILSSVEGDEPGLRLLHDTEECDRFVAVSGVHRPELLDPLHERIVEGELEVELVLSREIIDFLESYHSGKLRDVVESGGLELHRLEEDLPYGLVMTETGGRRRVYLVLHGERNSIEAAVVNESGASVEAFEDAYCAYRGRAESYGEVDLPAGPGS